MIMTITSADVVGAIVILDAEQEKFYLVTLDENHFTQE